MSELKTQKPGSIKNMVGFGLMALAMLLAMITTFPSIRNLFTYWLHATY